MKRVCGNYEKLPEAFAELDRDEELKLADLKREAEETTTHIGREQIQD